MEPLQTADFAGLYRQSGNHMLLRLVNSVNTKRAAPGDRIYLETASPVFVNRKMVIPTGSYVQGTVVESQRPGKVKGRAQLTVQFDLITLRNGVSRDLRERPSSVDTQGDLDKKEGRITGDSSKGTDAAAPSNPCCRCCSDVDDQAGSRSSRCRDLSN